MFLGVVVITMAFSPRLLATRPPTKIPQHARTTRPRPRRRAAAGRTSTAIFSPQFKAAPKLLRPPGRAARPRRARDVGAALLGRRPAAKLGARRGRRRRRRRRRGGDVRVAVQPGAARAGVRGAVRGARVGVPRLPLRLPHAVRPSISSRLPSPWPLPPTETVRICD